MNEKLFQRIMTVILILGALSAAGLALYTFLLYKDCSVLSYIANKG